MPKNVRTIDVKGYTEIGMDRRHRRRLVLKPGLTLGCTAEEVVLSTDYLYDARSIVDL